VKGATKMPCRAGIFPLIHEKESLVSTYEFRAVLHVAKRAKGTGVEELVPWAAFFVWV
jgi:hypothetical protein